MLFLKLLLKILWIRSRPASVGREKPTFVKLLMTSRIYFSLSTFKEFSKLRFMQTALEKMFIFVSVFHFSYIFTNEARQQFVRCSSFYCPYRISGADFSYISYHLRAQLTKQKCELNLFTNAFLSISEFIFNLSKNTSSDVAQSKYFSSI